MELIPEPIYYKSLRTKSGSKKLMIEISNPASSTIKATVSDVDKPEWLDLQHTQVQENMGNKDIYAGTKLKFPKNQKIPVMVVINTNHDYFPEEPIKDERVRLTLDIEGVDEPVNLDIAITIPEIISLVEPFRGVFAVDFGTTNSCYAFKGTSADTRGSRAGSELFISQTIPTLIFFHDVSDDTQPRYTSGREAMLDIIENSSQVYSYVMSIKRRLGMSKKVLMLDRLSGVRPEHRQEWHVEEIAAFILRDIITDAEEKLQKKIVQNVVATFPPLFSMDRKMSIRNVYHRAFRFHNKESLSEDNLVMILDEANAAAFNYIYKTMLNELSRIQVTKQGDRQWIRANLLSFDFGGGTIDISVVYVEVENVEGRTEIRTELKGVTGEANYGGDNVTLEVFKLLKMRVAQAIARSVNNELESRLKAIEEAEASKKKDGEKKKSFLDLLGGGDDEEDEEDEEEEDDLFWDDDKDKEEAEETAEEVEEEVLDSELQGLINPDLQEEVPDESKKKKKKKPAEPRTIWVGKYKNAIEQLVKYDKVVNRSVDTGRSLEELSLEFLRESDPKALPSDARKLSDTINDSVETLVPTRYGVYERENDPIKERIANRLFQELWQVADSLKIAVAIKSQEAERETAKEGGSLDEIQDAIWSVKEAVTANLKRIAYYSGVDAINFNRIEITMRQIENWIETDIEKTIKKAYNLFESITIGITENQQQPAEKDESSQPKLKLSLGGAQSSGGSGRVSDMAESMKDVRLRILLFGNSSNLPIVRRLFNKVFKSYMAGDTLVFDPEVLKSSVASGACEEYSLRKVFGGGLIKYSPSGFLNKLPYSLGLHHSQLERAGFPNGYAPVFERGDKIRKTVLLNQNKYFMINPRATELAIHSDYKDGSTDFQYIGFFDFTESVDFDTVCAQLRDNVPPPPDRFSELKGKSVDEIEKYIEETKDSLMDYEVDQARDYLDQVKLWTLDKTLFDEIDQLVKEALEFGESETDYRVAMHLLPTREVLCIRVRDRQVYKLKVEPFDIDKVENNPFSGTW